MLGLHSRYLGPKISLQAVMDLLDLATLRHPRGTRPRERQMRCPPLGLRAVSPVWEPVPSRSHHHAHLWAETHRQWVSYGDRLNVLRRVPVWD